MDCEGKNIECSCCFVDFSHVIILSITISMRDYAEYAQPMLRVVKLINNEGEAEGDR